MGCSRANSGRIRGHIRSNVVGYVAVFLALSGTAAALPGSNTVFSDDITNGEVRSPDVKNGSLGAVDIRANSMNSSKVNDESLTGVDVANGSLTGADVGGDALGGADIAPNAIDSDEVRFNSLTDSDIGANAIDTNEVFDNSLTGADINESTLNARAMGCQTGNILGFARVKGSASMPSDWTSDPTWIDRVYNCAGGPVSVRAGREGLYWVRFEGNPATLPIATLDPADQDNFVSAKLADFPCAGSLAITGTYCVFVRDNDGDSQHGSFAILLP